MLFLKLVNMNSHQLSIMKICDKKQHRCKQI